MRRPSRRGKGVSSGAGNGASAWTPASFGANLLAWYKAIATDLTLSGTDVTAWAAHLGYGPDLTVVGGTPQWSSSDSGFGGHGSVDFVAASSEKLGTDSWTGAPDGDDVPYSFCVALRPDPATAGHSLLSWGNSAANTTWSRLHVNGSSNIEVAITSGAEAKTVDSTATSDAQVLIYTTSGTSGNLYKDGTLIAGPSSMNVAAVTADRFTLGCLRRNTAGESFADVTVAEMAIFDKELSPGERNAMQKYFAREHGL